MIDAVNVDRGDIVSPGPRAAAQRRCRGGPVDTPGRQRPSSARKRQRNEVARSANSRSPPGTRRNRHRPADGRVGFARAPERLKLRSIHSPIRGVIVDRLSPAGRSGEAGEDLPHRPARPLYVETILPSRMFGKVRAGQVYDVTLSSPRRPRRRRSPARDRVIDARQRHLPRPSCLANPASTCPPGRPAINFQL